MRRFVDASVQILSVTHHYFLILLGIFGFMSRSSVNCVLYADMCHAGQFDVLL